MSKEFKKICLYQWGLLLLVFILIGGAVVHNLYKSYHDILAGEQHRLLTQARVVHENIASQIAATDRALKFFCQDLKGRTPATWHAAVSNKRMQLFEEVIPGIRVINAIDSSGCVRLSNRSELVGRDLSLRDYFRQAQKQQISNTLYLSAPFRTVLGIWGMNLVRVIEGPEGTFGGVVTATLNPGHFETLLRSVNYSPDMLSAIVHGDGLLFSMSPERTELIGKNLGLPGTLFSRHLASGNHEDVFSDVLYATNDRRIVALTTFSPFDLHLSKPLVVFTSRRLDAITADWRKHVRYQASMFSIITLASSLALLQYQRRRRVHIAREEQVNAHLRKLTLGIENSANGVMITDVNGNIEYVNRKFTQVTGFSADEAIGRTPRILKSETTPREVFSNLWETIVRGEEWRGELQNRRKNGEIYWSVASISPLRDEHGRITHFIANVEDISERKNAEATIEHLAYYDPLTDLPNRRMLQDRLVLAIRRSQRHGSAMALLYLDLDGFKHINDNLGHPSGDRLLQEMAGRYRTLLRDDDLVCRLGGDEFAVILHDILHEEDVALVANKLLTATSLPMHFESAEVLVTASIGVALFPKDGEDSKTLERNADIALYHAKGEGKNTFRFFADELTTSSRDRIAMEHGLRYALERNELTLLYQPKVDLTSGRVVGVEALLRWNSPAFGFVSPVRFIPLAEETRLIIPIGEWVLQTACRQQVLWREQGLDLQLAVNLSSVQFKSPGLLQQIALLLDQTGIEPEQLELELTESVLIEKPDDAVRTLEGLRSLGCGIAIDDFGTGYSSLSYLKNLPITVLKIDRSFVRDLVHDSGDRAIARSVVELAKSLDMHTVAEGIEQQEQQHILQGLGCTYGQGFLYSRPVAADKMREAVIRIESLWNRAIDISR